MLLTTLHYLNDANTIEFTLSANCDLSYSIIVAISLSNIRRTIMAMDDVDLDSDSDIDAGEEECESLLLITLS